jgi:hypothetical protein
MQVRAKKHFQSLVAGTRAQGEVFWIDDHRAERLISVGVVEPYQTKVVRRTPVDSPAVAPEPETKEDENSLPLESGQDAASLSAEAAQASLRRTRRRLRGGATETPQDAE